MTPGWGLAALGLEVLAGADAVFVWAAVFAGGAVWAGAVVGGVGAGSARVIPRARGARRLRVRRE